MAHHVGFRTTGGRAAAGVLLLALAGCSSTRLINSWGAPGTGPLTFRKVLVICITPDRATRRLAEDALAAQATRAQATPSYTLLSDEDVTNEAKVQAAMAKGGFDGTVTVRVVSATKERTYVPGTHPVHYNRFGTYYGTGRAGAYNPGHVRVDDVVRIETNVYSVEDGRLVWTGTSETINPTSIETSMGEIARLAVKDLRKRGLIAAEGK